MSSEEEDYMSDAFLLKCADPRPGLAPKRKQIEYEKEKKERESNKLNKVLPRKQLEAQQRNEGLNTSISQNNKGFALLQKMGYKPGSGIGKSGEGRVEPIGFELKAGRSGLGKDSEMKRKSTEMNKMRHVMLLKRKKMNEKQTESFQSRMKEKYSDKTQERDLRTAQTACIQLDQQAGLSEPHEPFYWPTNKSPTVATSQSTNQFDEEDDERGERRGAYDRQPYEDPNEDEEEECDQVEEEVPYYADFSTAELTDMVTRYLRNVYRYCIWCGTSYEDEQELNSTCPGNSAEDHDN